MFRQLANLVYTSSGGGQPPAAQNATERVLDLHPVQLSRALEEAWRARDVNLQLLTPGGLEVPATSPIVFEGDSGIVASGLVPAASYPPTTWDHLIYAYMVENTRVYEIFRRVLEEYAYGERLGVASAGGLRWLRTTEQLFYGDGSPFAIQNLTSWVRPDARATRRNAYQRLFGLDLNHGTDDNRPYPYPRATAANVQFVTTFESLLREVWRAIENVANQIGPNQTDISTIANLATALYDMLRVRRQDGRGNLGRDELFHVSTMSWFQLTLTYDTPIVVDLQAQATSPAERLLKIGERVGLPAHSRSESYFHLAESLSPLLRAIENGLFNSTANAPGLYQTPSWLALVQETITHWSIATGRDVKARPTALVPPQPQPIRPTPRPIATALSGNGQVTDRETLPV